MKLKSSRVRLINHRTSGVSVVIEDALFQVGINSRKVFLKKSSTIVLKALFGVF